MGPDGRARALHVGPALECVDFAPADHAPVRGDGSDRCPLVATEFYELAEIRGLGDSERALDLPDHGPVLWMVMRGDGRLEHTDDPFEPVPFRAGSTVLLPAALRGLRAVFERDTTILETRFPVA